jgi:hypothetical protein
MRSFSASGPHLVDCARTSLRSDGHAFLSRLLRRNRVARPRQETGASYDRERLLVTRGFLRSGQRGRSTARSGVVGRHVSILSPNGGNRRSAIDRSDAAHPRRGIRVGPAAFLSKRNVEVGDMASKFVIRLRWHLRAGGEDASDSPLQPPCNPGRIALVNAGA